MFWGIGAVGSAPHWQCGGHGFESRMLHQGMLNPFRMGSAFYFENNAANVPVIYYNPDNRFIFFVIL